MSDIECNENEINEDDDINNGDEVSFARAPYFQKYYATRIGVTMTEYDIRLDVMNEKIRDESSLKDIFIIDQMIILTPLAAKELSEQLQSIIKQWEEKSPIQPRPDKTIYSRYEVE